MDKSKNKSNLKQAVPFFMVTNMDRSLDFYVKGIGFEKKMDWQPQGRIEWCLIEREGIAVMLQEYRKDTVPQSELGKGVSIYFVCGDSLILYKEFLDAGRSPDEPFVGNNMWVVGIKDPDGYVLNFESATDVKEGATYSEWIISQGNHRVLP